MAWTEGCILGEDTRLIAEFDSADGRTLWYARDAENDRDVIVEAAARPATMNTARSGARGLLAFHADAEAAMALRHPSLLTVFDHGLSEDGLPYVIRDAMPSCMPLWIMWNCIAWSIASMPNEPGCTGSW